MESVNYKELKKQILISDKKNIVGKTIEDIRLVNDSISEESQLLITFTDGTFCGVEYNGNDDIGLDDAQIMIPSDVEYLGNVYFVGDEPKFALHYLYKVYKEMGIIDIDENSCVEMFEKAKAKKEEREVREYLKLRDKYEGNLNELRKKYNI